LGFYETLWCGSPRIYIGPVGAAAVRYPEACAFDVVVTDYAITDSELVKGLSHPDGTFAGYCFEVLLARDSPLLADLPAALYERDEPVSMGLGCIGVFTRLGDYVRNRLSAESRNKPNNALRTGASDSIL
jgi:hypothetical protein